MEGDPDDDPRYIREVRTGSWSKIIADELDVAGITVAPAGEHLFAKWKLRYTILTLSADTRNVWGARMGVDPSDTNAMIELSKNMGISKKSFHLFY